MQIFDQGTDVTSIRLTNLTKKYQEGDQERIIFRDLNAVVREGEFVVLLGRSGSGKTTLLNLISGIDLPTSGEVFIGNTNLSALSERERTIFRREHVGFIFQSLNLIPTLTVAENVLLPLELKSRVKREEVRRMRDLLEAVSLADRADSFPDRLSGGERQRVAVARALVHKPKLLLADEPTGNLDYETGKQVMALLNRLVRQVGQTIILVTHDRDLTAYADRVLVLKGGTVREETPGVVKHAGG